MSGEAPSRESRRRGRRRGLLVALIAAMVLVYIAVVAVYGFNERFSNIRGCNEEAPADAVLLSLSPESVDAGRDRLLANLTVLSFGPIASTDTSLLSEPLTVLVSDTDGPRTFTIAQDEIPSPQSINFITDGEVERWPFDVHSADIAIVAIQGDAENLSAIPTQLCGSAHVPGWTFTSQEIAGTDEIVINGEPVAQVRITATRSGATIAFGIVILVLMTVLPVLCLTVAIVAYRGIRKVEATLMSWMAAMLFATIPMRSFLPGSPPVGSWVDYLVVLWVVAGLIVGLVIYVLAWLKWSARGERGAPDGSIAVAASVGVKAAADADAGAAD